MKCSFFEACVRFCDLSQTPGHVIGSEWVGVSVRCENEGLPTAYNSFKGNTVLEQITNVAIPWC